MNDENQLSPNKMTQLLEWSYEKAINGLPGTETAEELAQSYLKKHGNTDKAISSLIAWQNTKAGTSGFLTGLGGSIVLPVAIPANIASILYVQIRMVAAIAYLRGYDVKDDQVKTMVFVALTGKAAADILKDAGIKAGQLAFKAAINKVPREVLKKINQKVGFRLVTKFGEKGVINLGKMVPVVGGVVGGTVDTLGTNAIGKTANKLFVESPDSILL